MAVFGIKRVLLKKSTFEVASAMSQVDEGVYEIEVSISHSRPSETTLIVTLNVILSAKTEQGENVLSASVDMDGIFEIEDGGIDIDYIANVNGAAIIYPFIRQHLADLTIKAGSGSLLIPPFNFVGEYQRKMFESNKSEKDGSASE